MKTIDCQDYQVIIGQVKESLESFLANNKYQKIAILIDENSKEFCLPLIEQSIKKYTTSIIEIQSGEENKNLDTCTFIWKSLMKDQFDRHSLLINLGGGVIGDMGGFCASTYMRGFDFIHIPTTLLSQVDSSVGGKLGVDLDMVKNIVGVFANPKTVLVDKEFLKTLPSEQVRSGYAEIVKHGLIEDPELYNDCIAGFSTNGSDISDELLYRSISVKKRVVEIDPRESGLRKILNYGHTIGHAVETHSWDTDSPLLHGEAIYVGMICENFISFKKGMLSEGIMNSVNTAIQSIFYKKDFCDNAESILEYLKKDKKNKNNTVYAALISNIGSAKFHVEITKEEVLDSFNYYKNL